MIINRVHSINASCVADYNLATDQNIINVELQLIVAFFKRGKKVYCAN